MKKFLLFTMLIFTFPVIAVQNQVPVTAKKQPLKTASFDPNTVTLSFSIYRRPNNLPNLPQGCFVDVWVGYVDQVQGVRQNNPGWPVTYMLYSGPGPVPPPSTTDQHGFVLNQFIPFNTTVRAKVVVTNISTVTLLSDVLTCTNHGPTEK